MKKIILLFIAASAAFSAFAQVRGGDNFYAQKWVVDLNLPVGVVMQSPTVDSKSQPNYAGLMNAQTGTMKMNAGMSYGADLELGYFIGKGRHWGIGAGIMYSNQMVDATLDRYHIEYQAYDFMGDVFRQLVTASGGITEKLTMTNINIPVVLKYKRRFSTRIGFTADAGILYNVSMVNKYNTNAAFDYEAIYQLGATTPGTTTTTTVYDNSPTPNNTDVLFTKAQIQKHTSDGVSTDFQNLKNQGYSVGLGMKPTNNSGTINYTSGSIGFILRPSFTIRLLDRVHLSLGAYYTYQSFQNNAVASYKLIDKMGTDYSSILNTVKTVTSQSAGINIGLRYFIGRPKDSDFDGKFDQ